MKEKKANFINLCIKSGSDYLESFEEPKKIKGKKLSKKEQSAMNLLLNNYTDLKFEDVEFITQNIVNESDIESINNSRNYLCDLKGLKDCTKEKSWKQVKIGFVYPKR